MTQLEPHERDIAMVFQDYALYPHMTVQGEYVLRPAFSSGMFGGPRIDRQVD